MPPHSLLLLPLLFLIGTHAKRLPQIYWNSTNPFMFSDSDLDDEGDIISEETTEENGKVPGKKRRMNYSLEFKKKAVDFASKTNNRKAAEKFGVARTCIQKWKLIGAQLEVELSEGGAHKKMRLDGGGRHLKDVDFDEELVSWVKTQRENKMRVTRSAIQNRARQMNKELRASNGWLESFLKRHGLVSRRPTTVCQKAPEQYIDIIINFLLYVEQRIHKNQYTYVYSCDETSVFLDFSNSMTVDKKGAQQVTVKSTGHDKLRVTVMLCARSDGYKCRPFVLLPKKRNVPAIEKSFGKHLELSWCGRTFFNDEITKQFLHSIIGNSLFGKRLIVWDSYRCHISADTKKVLKNMKVDAAVIPGGTTKFLQAPDVYWNFVFKAKIRKFYEDWLMHGVKSYTAGGNMRAPPMEVYLKWILDSWNEMPDDLIKRSFTGCGLNNAYGGSDDDKIHCLKDSGEMVGGLQRLKEKRNELSTSMDSVEDLIDDLHIIGESDDMASDQDPMSDESIDIEN